MLLAGSRLSGLQGGLVSREKGACARSQFNAKRARAHRAHRARALKVFALDWDRARASFSLKDRARGRTSARLGARALHAAPQTQVVLSSAERKGRLCQSDESFTLKLLL